MARRTQAGLRGGLWRSIRGAATKIRARAAAAATLGAWAKESECCVCVLCVLTAEKRRVLSRVRRGALYLSRRRAPRVEMNVPKTEFAGRNTHAERTPLSSRRDQLARPPACSCRG